MIQSRILSTTLVTLVFILASFGYGAEKVIGYLGVVRVSTGAYLDKEQMSSAPEMSYQVGDKVVIVSTSNDLVRVLIPNDVEAFLVKKHIQILEPVTLKGAISKVSYFDRMARSVGNRAYYDSQAEPWVLLAARELAKGASDGLPEPESVPTEELAAPTISVKNDTEYTIRILLTGSRAYARSIQPRGTLKESLPAGVYRILAEVTGGRVRPLKSSWRLQQGYAHSMTLYIRKVRS